MSDYGWVFGALDARQHHHDFKVLEAETGEPSGIVCRTCGRTWPIE